MVSLRVIVVGLVAVVLSLASAQTMAGCYMCCAHVYGDDGDNLINCTLGCENCDEEDTQGIDGCNNDYACECSVRYMTSRKCYGT
eukprot:snap_masked-scaffold_1-processed-gene-15.18-mRNA-1 protein AED:1.00 eAED:1.00 QI:0/-1/0/0/-1/1/1/0/84